MPSTTITTIPSGGPLSQVNDSLYAHVLARALNASGAVSIAELRSDTELTKYLGEIARMRTDVFVSRESALAFWVNAHNAYVLDLLRSTLSAHSTDDISGFRYAKVVLTGGAQYSLDDIEHTVLTTQFREPRVFFALWDGSRSSPPLRAEPYADSRLSEQLDDQLTHFLADSTKNVLVRHANTLYLSEIFRSYQDELEKVSGTLGGFVQTFAPPTMASWIKGHPALQVEYLRYDNTINRSDIETPHPAERPKRPSRRTSGGIQ